MTNSKSLFTGILPVIATALLYYIAGQLALPLAIPPAYAAAIWPPAGIALAALLLWGNKVLPGIVVAELLINLQTYDNTLLTVSPGSIFLFIGIGINAALRSWLGAYLVKRLIGFPNPLTSAPAISAFFLLAGPCAALPPALLSTTILQMLGIVDSATFWLTFMTWWLGDCIGIVIFTPMFLIVFERSCKLQKSRCLWVGVPLLATLLMTVLVCFYAQQRENDRLREVIASKGLMYGNALLEKLQTEKDFGNALKSFIASSQQVSREEFATFASTWLPAHPEVRQIAWLARGVKDNDDAADDGQDLHTVFVLPGIMNVDESGRQFAWQKELLTDWIALQNAGQGNVHGILTLLDDNIRVGNYLLYVPLAARQPAGFIVLEVNFDAFIEESLKQFDLPPVALQLTDDSSSSGEKILYRSENYSDISDPLQLSVRYPLAVSSGVWTLQVSPATGFLGQHYSWTVWGVLLAVMLFTTLLSIGLLVLSGQAEQVRQKVEQRTEALHLANSRLQESETQFRELVQSQAALVWRADPETWQFTFVSDEAESILGYPPRQWLQEQDFWIRHIYSEDRDWVVASCKRHIQEMKNQEMQYRMVAADGRVVWIRDVVNLVVQDNQVRELVGFINDITEQKAAEEQLRLAATTFESLQGIFITDRDGTILRVNKAFTDITGYTAEEVLGKKPDFLKSGRDNQSLYESFWQQLLRIDRFEGETWNRRKNGEICPLWQTVTAVKDEQGQITHYVSVFSDITEKKQAEDRIHSLAFYDPLTGLPNRRLLLDRLEKEIAIAKRHKKYGAILFLDLDNFKVLNDSLGHQIGDELLIQVAIRLEVVLRQEDTPARLGGDEFVVLVRGDADNTRAASDNALVIAEKVQKAINEPYILQGAEHYFSCSIGITLFPEDGEKPGDLLQQADTAMYRSKSRGKNTISFFHRSMQEAADARLFMGNELRNAFARKQLLLHYQPQVDERGRIVSAEALLRWNHPQKGIIASSNFIEIAEDTWQIIPIGIWALREACLQKQSWAAAGVELEHVSVNIGLRQFRHKDFVRQIQQIIEENRMMPGELLIELTEAVVSDNIEETIRNMQDLQTLGVGLAIDDFGTGYSSLTHLKQLPLDQLKIDQSFVRDIGSDANDRVIVETIIDMARNLGLEVVAEGVETRQQVDFLTAKGCAVLQGYYFSRPCAAEAFAEFYLQWQLSS